MALQLHSLERRTQPGGKDKVTHPEGGHDDVANAACGALVMAARSTVWDEKEMEARLPVIQHRAVSEMDRLAKDRKQEQESMGDEFYGEPGACRLVK